MVWISFIPNLYLEHDSLFLDALINLVFFSRTAEPTNQILVCLLSNLPSHIPPFYQIVSFSCLSGKQEVVESAHSTSISHTVLFL